MGDFLDAAPRKLLSLLREEGETGHGMDSLIDWCAKRRPHRDWRRLRALRWAAATRDLTCWLCRLLLLRPLSSAATTLHVGLFNPIYDERQGPVADCYVSGVSRGRGSDPGAWKVVWEPSDPYSRSNVLRDLYRIAYANEKSLGNDAEYPLVLAFAAMFARDAGCALAPLIARNRRNRAMTVGFDSGDILLVGEAHAGRFVLAPRWL